METPGIHASTIARVSSVQLFKKSRIPSPPAARPHLRGERIEAIDDPLALVADGYRHYARYVDAM